MTCPAVLPQSTRVSVTDRRRTDGIGVAYTRYSIAVARKKQKPKALATSGAIIIIIAIMNTVADS